MSITLKIYWYTTSAGCCCCPKSNKRCCFPITLQSYWCTSILGQCCSSKTPLSSSCFSHRYCSTSTPERWCCYKSISSSCFPIILKSYCSTTLKQCCWSGSNCSTLKSWLDERLHNKSLCKRLENSSSMKITRHDKQLLYVWCSPHHVSLNICTVNSFLTLM